MKRVLIVDDEPQILRALRLNLVARHYEVETAADGSAALRQAADSAPDKGQAFGSASGLAGRVGGGLMAWAASPSRATRPR